MARSLFTMAALISAALAQPAATTNNPSAASSSSSAAAPDGQTTVSVILPIYKPDNVVGSVVKVDSDRTTYAIACADSAHVKDCFPLQGTQTLVEGPSTWSLALPMAQGGKTLTQVAQCDINQKKTDATCHFTAHADGTDTTSTTTISDYHSIQSPLVITAGAQKLPASASASPSATDSAASDTASATSPPSASSTSSSDDGSDKDGGAVGGHARSGAMAAMAAAILGAALML